MNKMLINIIIFLSTSIITFLSYNTYQNISLKIKAAKKVTDYYEKTNLRLSGGTRLYNNGTSNPWLEYDIRSWDAGKNWYAVNYNYETDELKILGEVEEIHPGLMEHIKAWDNLVEYVQTNGPISIDSIEDIKMLEKTGISVTNK